MLDALEKDLHLDLKEKSKKRILDTFKLARSLQLPVIDDNKVVGILDLHEFLGSSAHTVNIGDIMEKDIVVAGKEKAVFSFKRSTQQILPFVDENETYIGFINKVYDKCYLPSKEYLQVIERNLQAYDEEDIDYDKLESDFSALVESNYDGLYITVDKGETLSINRKSILISGMTQDDVVGDGTGGVVSLSIENDNIDLVTNTQIVQNKQEISISDELFSDGGIIRVIDKVGNIEDVKSIKGFEKIKNELAETQKLKDKYQDELQFLQWEQNTTDDMIADSPVMKKAVNLALRVAKVDSTVLIEGPSGSGKGVISKLIHENSNRKESEFIKIDCGSIPESLLESELFGYEKGAFTGAEKEGKIGLVELADKGTLFLDEIGEFPYPLQTKLLRLIQDREIVRVGGNTPIKLDIRVIAATNRNLSEMVEEKSFRKDLYYRLNVVPIKLSPLRDRPNDVRPLIEYYLNANNEKYDLNRRIESRAMKMLINYSWPGNVRELENMIENLVVTATSDTILTDELPEKVISESAEKGEAVLPGISGMTLKEAINAAERNALIHAMRESKNTDEMAKKLKVDRSTIVRKLQKHSLKTHFDNK